MSIYLFKTIYIFEGGFLSREGTGLSDLGAGAPFSGGQAVGQSHTVKPAHLELRGGFTMNVNGTIKDNKLILVVDLAHSSASFNSFFVN